MPVEVANMQPELRLATTVLPGHRIEVTVPELPAAAKVEVGVVLPQQPSARFDSALDFLEALPSGTRAFKTWELYEKHLREERDAWER